MLTLSSWRIEQGEPLSSSAAADAEVLRWQDPATPLSIAQVSGPGSRCYRLRMNSDVVVDVQPDGHIVTRLDGHVPQSTIDHFLADQVFPRALAHTGSFVFHAGAVKVGQGAVIFMGRSGRGKSTLTASFDRAGIALLGDDAMVLSWHDDVPQVSPVYPSLRLFPDSLHALMPATQSTGPVAHYSTKHRIDVEVASDAGLSPLPVQALFAIGEPSKDGAIAIRPLSAAATCMTLVESSFALDPADLDRARRRLDEASRLAGLVPAFEISYPHDYGRLAEVRCRILDQVAALERA